MACPREGTYLTWQLYSLLQSVRHHVNLERGDSPGFRHVTRGLHGRQGSSDTPWCCRGVEGDESSLAPCPAMGRAGPRGKALASTEATSGKRDKRASARATTSYRRDKVIRTGNFFWQGSAHGLGPRGAKLSIKPCPINVAYISGRIWNVNTHASRHKVTTKCLVLKRNFLLSNLFPIFR